MSFKSVEIFMSKESKSGGTGAGRKTPRLLRHPVGDTEARILLEGQTEGAVATVAAAPGQNEEFTPRLSYVTHRQTDKIFFEIWYDL